MSDTWQKKVGRVLEEALKRPPEKRRAFLEKRCEKEALREEVASLLAAHEEESGLFAELGDRASASALGKLMEGRAEGTDGEAPGGKASDPLGLEGSRVGRYVVEGYLGGGGMGIVYRARDPNLDRTVALKFLPPRLARTEEAEERFVREAKAAATLDHAHIATVYEIGRAEAGEAEGKRYIAMAFCEGETLKEKLKREGALPVKEVLDYAEQIAEALSAAHEASVVHRDVKPTNVMVTREGEVTLLDFGLARLVESTRLTRPGQQLGTIGYMSPEQVEGEAIGPAADLWALGALLYEMLTGGRPFQGERRAAVLHAVVNEEPAPLLERRPEVPAALARVVRRCLEKDPADRYGSAEALRKDLRAARSREASAPSTVSPTLSARGAPTWTGPLAEVSRWWVAGGLLFLTTLAGAWWLSSGGLLDDDGPGGDSRGGPAEASERSVAVLPFEPLSSGEESETFARGVHGDLLTRLANISDLKVISRTTVQQYRDTDLTTAEIADSLGVRWVMEGGIQKDGGQVQVNAQLIDPQTDIHVWAEDYRRDLSAEDLFAIQEEIAREIADALQVKLTAGEQSRIAGAPTKNLKAYRLYVRGRRELARRTSFLDKHVVRAATLFRRAIEQDSSFALAWAGLADAQARQLPDSLGLPDVSQKEAARRALKLDPDLAEAHAAIGSAYLWEGNGPAAVRALRQALELKPSYWVAHNMLGMFHLLTGRVQEALDYLQLAVDLNPRHALARHGLYDAYLAAGQAKKSLEEARKQRHLGLEATNAIGGKVRALFGLGRLEKARRLAEEQISKPGVRPAWKGWFRAYLVSINAAAGDTSRAQKYLRQLQEAEVRPSRLAHAYAALGKTDRALETYQRLSDEDWRRFGPNVDFRYGIMYDLEPLRKDPRYGELIRKANQAWGLNPDGTIPEESRFSTETAPEVDA